MLAVEGLVIGVRDRDVSGRPRNARPRDALGRPLAHGSAGVDRVPDGLVLPPGRALTEAQQLLDDGLPFHAHEVFEGVWKSAPDGERALWQGLAQLAVGLTHLLRGNPPGAAAVLRRGQTMISPYAAHPPHAIDVPGLLEWTQQTLEAATKTPTPGDAAHALTPPQLRRRRASG
jgi:hypothetical protein